MIAEKIFALLQPQAYRRWRHSALYRPEIVRNKAYLISNKQDYDCDYINIDSLPPITSTYSLLTTVYNESSSIEDFLNSILRQSAYPSELVICDGGSEDNTIEQIELWKEKNKPKFSVKIIKESKCSIAKGRNIAARNASEEIYLFADAGTSLDKTWAEKILKGFQPDVDLVCGWYKPVIETNLQKAFAWFVLPKLRNVDPATFLPSGRSVGLRKSVFEAVGGYPEHLSFAGEDSLFGAYVKTASRAVAFVPDAYCYWRLPNGIVSMFRTVFRYSKGDGETGELFWNYYIVLLDKMGALIVHLFSLLFAFLFYLYLENNFFYFLSLVLALTYLTRALWMAYEYGLFAKASLIDKFYRALVLKFVLPAQLFGFFVGVGNRKQIEAKRIGKRLNAIVFLSESRAFYKDKNQSDIILSKYREGKYLTVIASKFVGNALRNPSIENHLRSEFDLDAWLVKHKKAIIGELEYIDLSQDAFSLDLIKRFKSKIQN